MTQIWKDWWPLLIAISLIQAANGLSSSLVSIASETSGLSSGLKGLVLSAFYAGSVAGALVAPKIIAGLSHVRAFAAFTLIFAAATGIFAIVDNAWSWAVLRALAGAGITGMFATAESWLNLSTSDKWRARVFGVYILLQLGGLTSGQFLLNGRWFGDAPLFMLASLLSVAALMFLRFERVQNPAPVPTRHLSLSALAQRMPMGAWCVALSGFAWAGLMASGPAYVEKIGLSDFEKSLFLASCILSGALVQLPIGWIADHYDRRRLLACMTMLACMACAWAAINNSVADLLIFAVVFGGMTFPLYAVGIALSNEVLVQAERTSASAMMIMFFDFGAVIAPFLLSLATDEFGPWSYFAVLGLPQLFFAVCVLNRSRG